MPTLADLVARLSLRPPAAADATLLAGRAEDLALNDHRVRLTLACAAFPPAAALMAAENWLAEQLDTPALELCVRSLNAADHVEAAHAAARLWPWLLASWRLENGYRVMHLERSELEAAGDCLRIVLPAGGGTDHLDELGADVAEFFRLRAGLELKVSECRRPEGLPAGQDTNCLPAQSRQVRDLIETLREQEREREREKELAAQAERRVDEDGSPVLVDANGEKRSVRRTPVRSASAYERRGRSTILGRFHRDMPLSEIRSFTSETGEARFRGEVADLDIRLTKNGKSLLVKFAVYGENGAVGCVKFVRPAEEQRIRASLKNGSYVEVEAMVSYDGTYDRDLVASVSGLRLCAPPLRRSDNWRGGRRVELHAHTKNSAQDGIADTAALVQRAADFGHPAIAITDHGVVQSFPEACETRDNLAAKGCEIKLIYGLEGYLVDDGTAVVFGPGEAPGGEEGRLDSFVVFDLESTGTDIVNDRIIEVAACRYHRRELAEGEEGPAYVPGESYQSLVNPGVSLSGKITELTGLTDLDLLGAPAIDRVLREFHDFIGDAVLVGHNVLFDLGLLRHEAYRSAAEGEPPVKFNPWCIDTLPLARVLRPELKNHRLVTVAPALGYTPTESHRAAADVEATGHVAISLLGELGCTDLASINAAVGRLPLEAILEKGRKPWHVVLLVSNQLGLYNLYRLVSLSHITYFKGRPRIPRSLLDYFRAGLIIGSACEAGEVFRHVLEVWQESEGSYETALARLQSRPSWRLAQYYDYLEVQPLANNRFMLRQNIPQVHSEEDLQNLNRLVIALGAAACRPVCATSDAHYIEPKDGIYRKILQTSMGFEDTENPAELHLRTTDEMMAEFSYLSAAEREAVVLTAPQEIARRVADGLRPFPRGSYPPHLPHADEAVAELTWEMARARYEHEGRLPELVETRIRDELEGIIKNGFGIMYYIAHAVVGQAVAEGHNVGSRGSVGSSIVAAMCGISEVNPLPPHYVCPNCHYSDFITDGSYGSGFDLEPRDCPLCGMALDRDGQDIPFETFLGFEGEKQPDIDLNFSGDYQARAHAQVEEMFGSDYTFRAGTITGYADKNALGLVLKYLETTGEYATQQDKNRLAQGLIGVKRTTGQHPGGIVVVPSDREIWDFTPIQYPANKKSAGIITTHFDFNALKETIFKFDILGHDDPRMLKQLCDEAGLGLDEIPVPAPEVLALLESTRPLGIEPGTTDADCGTLGLPELGTRLARDMIREARPRSFYDLLQLMGLSHGTDVWLGNARDLILEGGFTLSDVIGCRDGIMTTLMQKGVDSASAFDIMEKVRKGRGLTPEQEKLMRRHGVEDWYIESCRKIKYLFPKAHAAAYSISAMRLGWFKIHRPASFYAAWFTEKLADFDYDTMLAGLPELRSRRQHIDRHGKELPDREQRQFFLYELCEEMQLRGIRFLPVDLKYSLADRFSAETPDAVRPPFSALAGISRSQGEAIVAARADGPFDSQENLRQRTGLGPAAIATLAECDVLAGLPESSQMSFFELYDLN
ncbi:MAG: PolC-type DNA polymerase III [Bacillota bacterium]|nr:PolC-type DNA polymerase III [Bacillota bacterium]